MCTVSVIPIRSAGGAGFRVAHSRDELRSRSIALPPVVRRFGARQAILPIDVPAGGTWVAVNDAGVAFALLNVNHGIRVDDIDRRASRGRIIPSLLACEDPVAAVNRAREIDAHAFGPFRLAVVDGSWWGEVYSDGWDVSAAHRPFEGKPLFFTSSGLGDDVVDRPRRALFDVMVRAAGPSPRRQDDFHAHRWPDRPALSVLMSRPEARTVSRTVIEVTGDNVTLAYRADGESGCSRLRVRQLQCL